MAGTDRGFVRLSVAGLLDIAGAPAGKVPANALSPSIVAKRFIVVGLTRDEQGRKRHHARDQRITPG